MLLRYVNTPEEFSQLVDEIKALPDYPGDPAAFGIGFATVYFGGDGPNQILDVTFDHTNVGENFGSAAIFWAGLHQQIDSSEYAHGTLRSMLQDGPFAPFKYDGKDHPNITALRRMFDMTSLKHPFPDKHGYAVVLGWAQDFDKPPADVVDAWLRLTLLSQTKMRPNSMNLDGIFKLLPNVTWTNKGPLVIDHPLELRTMGVHVLARDKFPPMLDYVIPPGVRVADASRVRIGAHLASGTTVMHEGFVNFNAGSLGISMVEGRISQGVVAGDGSDIGGGASIMGTLSGGGDVVITLGEGCLLGANSGLGISLGHDCVVEAGLYLTAGTKVKLVNSTDQPFVKAATLSGENNLLFRRNSMTGEVEALSRNGASGVELNEALHANA